MLVNRVDRLFRPTCVWFSTSLMNKIHTCPDSSPNCSRARTTGESFNGEYFWWSDGADV